VTYVDIRTACPTSQQRAARSPWPTVLLCLAMLIGALVLLHRITLGFEAWTFEDRRQRLTPTGAFVAPAVSLRGVAGQPVDLWHPAANRPAAYLVDFIYTRCPGVCRALGTEYQRMQRQLAATPPSRAASDIRLVSLSFDVEHDDPERLAAEAQRLGTDPARWTFAVPATGTDARRLLTALGVVAIPDGRGGYVHNGDIHLLDARGRLHGIFTFGQWEAALAAAGRLAATAPESSR